MSLCTTERAANRAGDIQGGIQGGIQGVCHTVCLEALSGGIAGRNRQLEYGPRGKKKKLPRCVPLYYPDFEKYAKYTSCRVMMLVSGGLGGHGTVRSPFFGNEKAT